MRKPVFVCILCMLGFGCSPNVPDVMKGTWISDKEASMAFAKAHTGLSQEVQEILGERFGSIQISYGANQFVLKALDGEPVAYDYRILGIAVNATVQVSIKYDPQDLVVQHDKITTLNFVDDQTYWIYPEDGSSNPNPLNIREYFRKVSNEERDWEVPVVKSAGVRP